MDWAAYTKYLQTVFQEFNADAVISQPVLIRLFHNGLRPSIRAQAKQNGRQNDIWKPAIKKPITTEAKTTLNLPSWVQKIDVCYPRSHWSSFKADKCIKKKMSNQNSSRSQELRAQPPQRFQNIKTWDRPWKDHKNNKRNKRGRCDCDFYGPRPPDSTPTTGINTTDFLAWNHQNHDRPLKREDKNLTQVICYNCNKKGHFAN